MLFTGMPSPVWVFSFLFSPFCLVGSAAFSGKNFIVYANPHHSGRGDEASAEVLNVNQ
jgi:hypothetical protein